MARTTDYRVPAGYKPTPAVVKANPTVKQFSTGQVIKVPVNPPPTFSTPNSFVPPPVFGSTFTPPTGSNINLAGLATLPVLGPTTAMLANSGRGTNYNNRTVAGVPTGSVLAGGGSLVNTGNGTYNLNGQYVGNGVYLPGGTPNSTFTIPSIGGGGNSGGGNGGGGGGTSGGGSSQSGNPIAPVVPIAPPRIAENDINVSLNWRVG